MFVFNDIIYYFNAIKRLLIILHFVWQYIFDGDVIVNYYNILCVFISIIGIFMIYFGRLRLCKL